MKRYYFIIVFSMISLIGWGQEIISFADAEVKSVCIAHWDTDGDGELSMTEAANVTSLEQYFKDNTSITSFDELQFFTGLSLIYPAAFDGCVNLASIKIPQNVTRIHGSAFGHCKMLTSIDIPEGVTMIDTWAFNDCVKLATVKLPESLESVDYCVFYGCKELASINIPSKITKIPAQFLCGCKSLSSIALPSGLTVIDYEAFGECENLTSIIIPDNVISIGFAAFSKCVNLSSVTLPKSLIYLGFSAFAGCSKLASINIPEGVTTLEKSSFSYCESLTSITIPQSVTTIEDHCFSGCSNLKTVILSDNIKKIEDYAFAYCDKLESVKSLALNPPTIYENTFQLQARLYSKLFVPKASYDKYKSADFWKLFSSILYSDATNSFTLTYLVDGIEYKKIELEYGASITPEPAPTKEGYTFSGWSDIPATMPANDVTVTGTFTINKYKLAYKVDGEVYKSYDVEYGASITPEPAPTKEGYTFSGWNDIPATMPANDVTVTGTFFVNKYKLTYKVDGEVYKSYDVEYGAAITPEPAPTKEGYTFSGWSEIPTTMPAKDVTVTGSFTANTVTKYKLTYKVDGEVYKTYELEEGTAITPEPAPSKEGYTFSGWSDIPATMPANDVTVTGTFSINKYKLTYKVDGEVYKSYDVEYGAAITPEPAPTKEGYTFSGWSDIPATMPAKDVTVTGSFIANTVTKFKLTYKVDGEVYKTYELEEGAAITPEPAPTKEGYTFSGWSDIPATMPARDVTVTGSFTVNKYKLIYKLDGQLYKSYDIEYGSKITPEPDPTKDGYTFSGWSDIPKTMPAKDVTVTGSFIKNEVPEQDEITQDNILYRIDRGYASVIQADKVSGDIKIEASIVINGMTYEVTAIAKEAFKGCTELTSVEIPNSIENIGDNAFDGCTALHLITIGSGIKEIGVRAFANISKNYAGTRSDDNGLHIYFDAESVPTTNSETFEDTDIANATLHVRDDMVNTFKAFNPWSNFGTIIGFSDTGIKTISIDTSDALIFDMQGNRLNYPQKGLNIIRTKDGKAKKIIVK